MTMQELTIKDIPAQLREAIIAEYQEKEGVKTKIAELTEERDKLATTVSELEQERDELTQKVSELEEEIKKRDLMREQEEFELAVVGLVREYVNWEHTDEDVLKKRDWLRRKFKADVMNELGEERDPEKVKTVAEKVWTDEYKDVAETFLASIAGPSAVVPRKGTDGKIVVDDSPEAIARARQKFGI